MTMCRYVDADKLSLELAEELEKNQIPRRNAKSNITYLLNLNKINYARFLLSVADTEDVVPVIHAHWEYRYDTGIYQTEFLCSRCKGLIETYSCTVDEVEYEYCPHCGAKMDEEV